MAKLLPIKIYPEPILRQKAKRVEVADLKSPEIQQLILDLGKTMQEKEGIGLAAPQVGQGLRIIVINTEEGVLTLINPKVLIKSWRKELGEEGCLSFPEIFGSVKRSNKVTVAALNKEGKRVKFTATDFFARVIQHEIDHLNGILFIDKAKKIIKGADKLKKLSKS